MNLQNNNGGYSANEPAPVITIPNDNIEPKHNSEIQFDYRQSDRDLKDQQQLEVVITVVQPEPGPPLCSYVQTVGSSFGQYIWTIMFRNKCERIL